MFSFKAKILFQKNHFGIKRGGGRTSANVEDISQTKSNNNKKEKRAKNMTNIFYLKNQIICQVNIFVVRKTYRWVR
jgi:hypothetical protein